MRPGSQRKLTLSTARISPRFLSWKRLDRLRASIMDNPFVNSSQDLPRHWHGALRAAPVKCYRRMLRKCEDRVGLGNGAEAEFRCDGWGIVGHQMIEERCRRSYSGGRTRRKQHPQSSRAASILMRDKLPKRALL